VGYFKLSLYITLWGLRFILHLKSHCKIILVPTGTFIFKSVVYIQYIKKKNLNLPVLPIQELSYSPKILTPFKKETQTDLRQLEKIFKNKHTLFNYCNLICDLS